MHPSEWSFWVLLATNGCCATGALYVGEVNPAGLQRLILILILILYACRLQVSLSDFEILRRLGDGSFSTVVLARYRRDGRLYAVKIVNKNLILRNKVTLVVQFLTVSLSRSAHQRLEDSMLQVIPQRPTAICSNEMTLLSLALCLQMADYIRNERNILDQLHHPGVADLQFTFQVGASRYQQQHLQSVHQGSKRTAASHSVASCGTALAVICLGILPCAPYKYSCRCNRSS